MKIDILVRGDAQVTLSRRRTGDDPWRAVRAEQRRQRGYTDAEWQARQRAWDALMKAEDALRKMALDERRYSLRVRVNQAWERYKEKWGD
jgi:hypothetical protein